MRLLPEIEPVPNGLEAGRAGVEDDRLVVVQLRHVAPRRAECPGLDRIVKGAMPQLLEKAMSSNALISAVVMAASLLSQTAMAQSNSGPGSRAEVKAETRAAEKSGKLVPAGQGPQFKVPTKSTKTRAQRKTETLAARRAGTLEPAGDADIVVADRKTEAQRSTVNRAARKGETREEEKAGLLTRAGEGPDAPRK